MPRACTHVGAKQPHSLSILFEGEVPQVRTIYLQALTMQACLQRLQFHADIFDKTSLMEKNDYSLNKRDFGRSWGGW